MNVLRSSFLAFTLASICASASAAPPVSAFTNFPRYESMKISPDGKFIALTQRTTEHEMMTVLRYPELSTATYTHFGDMIGISTFEWANNTRLLIQPERWFYGYTATKVPTGEIIGLDADGKRSELLFGFATEGARTGTIMQRTGTRASARIVDLLPDNPDEVLIQTRAYDTAGTGNSVQRMNVKTGRLAKIAGSPVQEANYITNSKHELVLVSGYTEKGDFQTHRFKPQDRSWQQLGTYPAHGGGHVWPFEDTANPDEFIALDSVNTSTQSVVLWNALTNEKRTLLHKEVADIDLKGVDEKGHVWLYGYDDHFPEYWYPNPEHPLARAHRSLRATFKDANVGFTSVTRDQSLAIAHVSAPRIPPTFYLLDVKNVKVLQQLPAYPDLKPQDLSPTDPIELAVRDGLKIRGYLTTPAGTSGKNLPMVVVLHGGPHGPYDRYDFDPEVQLFASRGYAVLQVNFRGSGGRGREFEAAGYKRWGREMQDDVTDAVKWAIGAGVADPKRLCLYGISYGAYASLAGTYREPEMFKCAVGIAGVYDLPLMYDKGDTQTIERGELAWETYLGTDMDDLRARSPVYNADKIKAAVLLIHGRIDERAPFEHARRMRAALEKAGNPPQWITESGEGHGIRKETTRVAHYEQILAFFAKHIGATR